MVKHDIKKKLINEVEISYNLFLMLTYIYTRFMKTKKCLLHSSQLSYFIIMSALTKRDCLQN